MNRPYRFKRLDRAIKGADELTLLCASPEDALVVARTLGEHVEVWDGATRVGDTADQAMEQAEPAPAAEGPFNPFRPGAWRSPRGRSGP